MPNQFLHPLRHTLCCVVYLTGLGLLSISQSAQAQVISESPEIVYSSNDAKALFDKATQLGTAVAIYEHVHNSIDFSPYHGSRSGAINTLMGQRGSDVDIASTLIAMLRSQKIPARYAVGTVRIPAEQLTNWLGIPQLDTALQVLKDQGIQNVTLATDRTTVDFEHAWVEAFVPFDQYRGINTVSPTVDCSQSTNAARCTWVALDASFKQKNYNSLNLDPYNAVTFDYTGYYNAIKDAATDPLKRRDKNPLAILEDQIGTWLRTNYPGKTLDDVEDTGQIIPLREGLLPASLPYQVVGNVRRYDTVALHDAVVTGTEPKKWGKRLTITAKASVNFSGGGTITLGGAAGGGLLAELSTKRLTITTEFSGTNKTPQIVTRLDGVELARPIVGSTSLSPSIGGQLTITLSMDGAPSVTSGVADRTIDATYSGTIGGYYLIATGGESSNWSQVHRAAAQLLAANDKYKIVFNAAEVGCLPDGVNCTPYVDANMNGWDASDTKLLETKDAMDGLTGGLLNVAALQYYSKLRDQYQRADGLMKTKTPVIGFLGVVSSVYEAEYVDGTAFSILPGGLLIDMKGITVGGSYRTNEGAVARSNRQFEFLGHVGSSLEHETWQELTGYDAISTVRGIQMALANGGSLQKARKNATEDTMPAVYPFLGFNTTVPDGFTFVPYTIFSTAPATWSHATSGASFETIQGTVTASTTTAQRGSAIYRYLPTGGLYGWSKCVAKNIADISVYPSSQAIQWNTCIGSSYYERVSTILQYINNEWNNPIIVSYIGNDYFNYFDRNRGFSTVGRVYRSYPIATDAIDAPTIASIRDDLYLTDTSKVWFEHTFPSKMTVGSTYRFFVDISKGYTTSNGQLGALTFSISNRGLLAGGGYVGLDSPALVSDKNQADSALSRSENAVTTSVKSVTVNTTQGN